MDRKFKIPLPRIADPVGTIATYILGCPEKLKTEFENFELYL